MARNGDPSMALHSAAAAVVSQQPHPGQEIWFNQNHITLPQQREGEGEGRRGRRQGAVFFIVVVSVASFVRRLLMLVLGLLRLSYRKASHFQCFEGDIVLVGEAYVAVAGFVVFISERFYVCCVFGLLVIFISELYVCK